MRPRVVQASRGHHRGRTPVPHGGVRRVWGSSRGRGREIFGVGRERPSHRRRLARRIRRRHRSKGRRAGRVRRRRGGRTREAGARGAGLGPARRGGLDRRVEGGRGKEGAGVRSRRRSREGFPRGRTADGGVVRGRERARLGTTAAMGGTRRGDARGALGRDEDGDGAEPRAADSRTPRVGWSRTPRVGWGPPSSGRLRRRRGRVGARPVLALGGARPDRALPVQLHRRRRAGPGGRRDEIRGDAEGGRGRVRDRGLRGAAVSEHRRTSADAGSQPGRDGRGDDAAGGTARPRRSTRVPGLSLDARRDGAREVRVSIRRGRGRVRIAPPRRSIRGVSVRGTVPGTNRAQTRLRGRGGVVAAAAGVVFGRRCTTTTTTASSSEVPGPRSREVARDGVELGSGAGRGGEPRGPVERSSLRVVVVVVVREPKPIPRDARGFRGIQAVLVRHVVARRG
mmetsp:Transcript_10578/g.43838  ORF Transcript_10578/g.43838 Transcript_10578/m.43838 type:complete len:454 (-) Transcript_10578:404-1765(-)